MKISLRIPGHMSADARDQWREAKKEKGEECGVPRDRSDHDTETMPIVDVEQYPDK